MLCCRVLHKNCELETSVYGHRGVGIHITSYLTVPKTNAIVTILEILCSQDQKLLRGMDFDSSEDWLFQDFTVVLTIPTYW